MADDTWPAAFWGRVTKGAPDECWPWTGSTNEHGYGSVRRARRLVKAHRMAWMLTTGEALTPDIHICHRCDNPPCCNPAHLFRCDYVLNTADKVAKNRQSKGAARSAALRGSLPTGDAHWTRRTPERMNLSGLRRGS